jgi:hypothetical protein
MASNAADVRRWVRSARPSARELGEQLCSAVGYDRAGGVVRALLAAGAPANAVSEGNSALLWAMMGANAAAVRLLCAAGADTQALTEDGSRGLVMCLFGPLSPDAGTPRWSEAEYVAALRALAACGRDITRCHSEGRAFAPLCLPRQVVLAAQRDGGACGCARPGCGAGAGDHAKLLRCGACRRARYCSTACQRLDWPAHRGLCRAAGDAA